jgi:hypothetical protein
MNAVNPSNAYYQWSGRILTALATAAFVGSSVTKLVQVPKVIEGLIHAGIPAGDILPIGVLEMSLAILYLLPRTSVLGTFLLTGYIGGAILTHIVARQTLAPPVIVGLLMFAGAYFRHRELRQLVPLRMPVFPRDANALAVTTAR